MENEKEKEAGLAKMALIVEGGGFRGIFAAGVLDVLMEHHIAAEYVCGVSAGALTAYDYVADLPGRTCGYYKSLCTDKDFFSIKNFLRTGSLFSFENMYRMANDEYRETELRNLAASRQKFEVAATDLFTGEARFFSKDMGSPTDFLYAIKASSSMPGVNAPVEIDGVPYYDGGCAAPVPLKRAEELGYEKIMVILLRPLTYHFKPYPWPVSGYLKKQFKNYPQFYRNLMQTGQRSQEAYDEIQEGLAEKRVFAVAPSGKQKVGILERNAARLEALYQEGRQMMEDRIGELQEVISPDFRPA